MFTAIYQSIALLGIIISFYIMDFLLIHRFDRTRQASGTGRAWDFTLMGFGITALLVLQPLLLPQLGYTTAAGWGFIMQIAGILLALSALAFHAWARLHLQHFYAERVELQPGHRVVDTGPYAHVRHPIITSFFGLVLAMFLIVPALTTLAIICYTFWDFTHAAKAEEALLSQNLPEYSAYMARTSRFLPRLWRGK